MKSGWLKLYRSIIDWEWFSEHDMIAFLIWCLCNANVQDKKWRGVMIKAGQLVVSRSTVCKELGITDRRYRTIISRLSKSGEIICESRGAYSIISIVNWEIYQEDSVEDISQENVQIVQSACNEDCKNTIQQPLELFPTEEISQNKSTLNSQEVDCSFIIKLFNDRCKGLPKVIKLTEKRKKVIKIWFDDIGGSYDRVQEIFDKAQSSSFLRGDNNRAWSADFDWITHKSNWVRILEGKYDDKININHNNYETQQNDRYAKRRGTDSSARSSEDYSDTI